jgi:hypothetical protein
MKAFTTVKTTQGGFYVGSPFECESIINHTTNMFEKLAKHQDIRQAVYAIILHDGSGAIFPAVNIECLITQEAK